MAEDKEKTGERGYGNIYTPHAGAMIIHVQRESGLANRTIIFTQRQVRLFRIGAIVLGSLIAFGSVSWFFLAAQAARVPLLTRRVARLQQDVARVDTLQRSLNELAARFQQVQHMMGSSAMSPAGPDTSKSKALAVTATNTTNTPAAAAAVTISPPAPAVAIDSIIRPDEWPLPVAGALLPSDSKALEIAVPVGTEIRAAGAGLIVEVADDSTLGKLIRISHRSGYETVYGGANEVHVSKGQHVAAGTVIALSGNAPGTLEPHLHFEMLRHGVAIDASSVIKKGPGHGDIQ
ncbi:MAG: M23 family metallopeptidase [Gemmatimonadota bacterium]|nr:M23 family metallopeptidase [Gemmatimonadota bacterium]